jgi:glutamate-1-semialdehyde 2,1-aminomutase
VTERIYGDVHLSQALVEGIGVGGTLAGNVLSARAIAMTLASVLTEDDFVHMRGLARRWKEGVERHIAAFGLPWHVTQLGARAEYHFSSARPKNGSELAAVGDEQLERFLRLYLTNRGILTTPFHNMVLMAPTTSEEDVDHHDDVFGQALGLLYER